MVKSIKEVWAAKKPRTVQDVIETLGAYPPEMLVVVDGYEDGFAEDIVISLIDVAENHHGTKDKIYGRHGRADDHKGGPKKRVLFIGEGWNLYSGV